MNMLEKYLPIGTVVLLKGAKKRLMIIGICVVIDSEKDKMWDYNGCIYPEGLLTSAQSCLFNHDQIEKVFHLGLIDEEEIRFKQELIHLLETKKANEDNN